MPARGVHSRGRGRFAPPRARAIIPRTMPPAASSAASFGNPASRLMASASAAYTPVTTGPINASATSTPNRRTANARIDSSPSTAASRPGRSGSPSAASLPRHDSRRVRAKATGSSGTACSSPPR